MANQGEATKESANIMKAKHMMFVNHNMERAMQETTREGFDFRDTRNQFISTTKGASVFQKTTMNALNFKRMSYDENEIHSSIDVQGQTMDVIGLGLVTSTDLSKAMTPSINKTLKRTIDRRRTVSDKDN